MDAFTVACPNCDQQPQEECNWGATSNHPRFHAERIEVAAMIFGIEQGAKDHRALERVDDVAMGTIVDQMF